MKLERSREKEKEKYVNEESSFKPIKIQIPKNEYNLKLFDIYKKFKDEQVYNISIKDCLNEYDDFNYKILNNNTINLEKMKEDFYENIDITPLAEQEEYKNQMIDIIKNMNKSDIFSELPSLPFGKSLSDKEFILLLEECANFASFHLSKEKIEIIKKTLLNDHADVLENLFRKGKIKKDVIQNALLTILTTDNEKDQKDNFNLLVIKYSTATPLIKLDFNKNDEYKIDMNELIQTFSSHVYIKNFQKTFEEFGVKKNEISENKKQY